MSKNLFIDCGTNLGQGLKAFDKKYNLFNNPKWYIYTFEPNPYILLNEMFKDVKNLNKINKAIWINDNNLQFICKGKKDKSMREKYGEKRFQGGNSQIKETEKMIGIPSHVETDYITVESINFSNFLKDNANKYNEIIVKMDIEGAEFQIIDHLIKNDTLKIISELYIETHGRFDFPMEEWKSREKEIEIIENDLLEKCKKHISKVHYWS